MGNRDNPRDGRGGRPSRRPPPPDSTGAEANYLSRLKEARTPVVVRLADGESIRGVIEYFDRDMLKINREVGGPNVFIRKEHIRYLHEDPES